MAAAAIVAAALPGGQQLDEFLATLVNIDLAPGARLTTPAPELANIALDALLLVAGPQGPWHQGWTNDTDAAAARDKCTRSWYERLNARGTVAVFLAAASMLAPETLQVCD